MLASHWIVVVYILLVRIISGYRQNRQRLFEREEYRDPDRALGIEEMREILAEKFVKYAHSHRRSNTRHTSRKEATHHRSYESPNQNAWDAINTIAVARAQSYNDFYQEDEAQEMEVIDTALMLRTSNGGRNLFRIHQNKFQIRWPRTGSQGGNVNDRHLDRWDNWADFTWHDMVSKFNDDVFDADGRYAGMENRITGFRELCKTELLIETNGGGSALQNRLVCYDNMGSNNPTSDFDFTLVRWDEPQNIVTKLSLFYTQCHALLNNYPLVVFDEKTSDAVQQVLSGLNDNEQEFMK
eukprot:293216_1